MLNRAGILGGEQCIIKNRIIIEASIGIHNTGAMRPVHMSVLYIVIKHYMYGSIQ